MLKVHAGMPVDLKAECKLFFNLARVQLDFSQGNMIAKTVFVFAIQASVLTSVKWITTVIFKLNLLQDMVIFGLVSTMRTFVDF